MTISNKHWPPCYCIKCVNFRATCECCNKEFTSYLVYIRHMKTPKQKRGPKDPMRGLVIPDGIGFLTKVLANQASAQQYNLSVISRFCAALATLRPGKRGMKFTRAHKNLLQEMERGQEARMWVVQS